MSRRGVIGKSKVKDRYSECIYIWEREFIKSDTFLNAFNTRKALQLSEGKYTLTDGIWNYTLIRYKQEPDNNLAFAIYEGDYQPHKNHISFFIDEESVFDKEDRDGRSAIYRYGDIKRKKLSCLMSIGGLYVNSHEAYSTIRDLTLLPRGSFKEYVKNELP